MTRPVLEPAKIPTLLRGDAPLVDVPLEVDGERLRVCAVGMGNPHCVIFVDDPEAFPVERLGPRIEHHELFPERVNVEFVGVRSRTRAGAAHLGARLGRDARLRQRRVRGGRRRGALGPRGARRAHPRCAAARCASAGRTTTDRCT